MRIKKMTLEELKVACQTLRTELIEAVSHCGGHLGSNLGIVELTVALHYILDSPQDVILFDVGHQSYIHKMLTGRRDRMQTLRQRGGLSPFLDTSESEHDFFTTGHAGNIISAAAGIAVANPQRRVVAIIGDASLSNGEALEAINSINGKISNLYIIVNDNEMSIGENVGAIFKYLNGVLHNKPYNTLKKGTKSILERAEIGTKISNFAGRIENSVKYFLAPGNLFIELGYDYFGPLDGHNLELLIKKFKLLFTEEHKKTAIVHVKTIKGKGYDLAENNKENFHGVSPFEIESGKPLAAKVRSFSEIFGETMEKIAAKNESVCVISAAMIKGVGLSKFFEKYPDRSFDVGIAEMHAVTFAGGLAVGGKKPVVAIYSTFMQRAYDQLIHDISIQKLPVIFAMDRAGIVGEDGKTHHGLFDISFFRTIPNFSIYAPTCANELSMILEHAINHENKPIAIRIAKSSAFEIDSIKSFTPGVWPVLQTGKKVVILAVGTMAKEVLDINAQLKEAGINATIVAVSSILPLDTEFLEKSLSNYDEIYTVEENVLAGGFGSLVLEYLNDHGIIKPIHRIGIPDIYVPHGSRGKLLEEFGLSKLGLINSILEKGDKKL